MIRTRRTQAIQAGRPGAAVLILVLMIGAVALAVGTGIALGSIGEMSMGYGDAQSKKALALADSCAEEAMLKLRASPAYAGGTITLPEGSCVVAVSDSAGNKRIDVTATSARWTERASLTVDPSGSRLSLVDWKRN